LRALVARSDAGATQAGEKSDVGRIVPAVDG